MPMDGSDTTIQRQQTDTLALCIRVGQRVRVAAGPFEGLSGLVQEQRTGGSVLLKLERGIFVVVKQIVLETLDS